MKTILVAGSKELEARASAQRVISEKLGEAIVREPGWRVLTGGARGGRPGSGKETGSIDYHAALGAQRALADPAKERERILTLHPRDGRSDLFQIGSVLRSRAKSTPARRFELVSRADFVVAVEGHEGTAQIIEYAIAAGKPTIPLACTGGASGHAWAADHYRLELLQALGVQDPSPELSMIENGLGTPDALTATCVQIMKEFLRPSCFVVMPFALPHSSALWEDMLKPAIEEAGMAPVRADIVHNVGEILEDITHCIAESMVVVVDITGTNPNVMYELGYAHALAKPTVLICSTGNNPTWDRDLPFDIRGMRVIPMDAWDRDRFQEHLTTSLKQFCGAATGG